MAMERWVMSGDFGAPKRKADQRKLRLALILLAVLVVGAVAVLLWTNMDSRRRAIEGAGAQVAPQALIGPPCALGTPQGKLGRGDDWKNSAFNGLVLGRRIGHMECALAPDKAAPEGYRRVCQFSSPAELKVVTKGGAVSYFDIGLGKPATVIVTGEQVACVLPAQP